jgi:hypothetical protein
MDLKGVSHENKECQKWLQSKGLPLRMCWQGLFYIFNQAPSLNLQKFIQQHIIGKIWHFFPKMGIKY